MKLSFQLNIVLRIAGATLLVGLLGAEAQYSLVLRDMRLFQDDTLRQMAALALTHPGRDAGAFGRAHLADTDARIQVAVLPTDPRPAWFTSGMGDGLHSVNSGTRRMRVFVQHHRGFTAVVAQAADARDDFAKNEGWRALLPSMFLTPLLIWLVNRVVRTSFAPVVRAARKVKSHRAAGGSGLEFERLPEEIQPFLEAIESLLQRTQRLVVQQQRLVADAAHELRTPLTALALQVANVRRANNLEEARVRLIPLECGIARARKLSDQLLDLAKLNAEEVKREPVNLVGVARELLGAYHATATSRDIDFGLGASDDEFVVVVSPPLLRTILRNAIDNALKYTSPGGDVTLAISSFPREVRFDVVDSGPGIVPSERSAVFKPFYRIGGNSVEGCGLGLAIAFEAASRIGATVSLHDRVDKMGLVFRLTLPHPESDPSPQAAV